MKITPSPPRAPELVEAGNPSLASNRGLLVGTDGGDKGLCGKSRFLTHHARSLAPVTDSDDNILSISQRTAAYRLGCHATATGK